MIPLRFYISLFFLIVASIESAPTDEDFHAVMERIQTLELSNNAQI